MKIGYIVEHDLKSNPNSPSISKHIKINSFEVNSYTLHSNSEDINYTGEITLGDAKKYSKVEIKDTLAEGLKYKSMKIYNASNNNDVTSYFTNSSSNQNIKFTLKNDYLTTLFNTPLKYVLVVTASKTYDGTATQNEDIPNTISLTVNDETVQSNTPMLYRSGVNVPEKSVDKTEVLEKTDTVTYTISNRVDVKTSLYYYNSYGHTYNLVIQAGIINKNTDISHYCDNDGKTTIPNTSTLTVDGNAYPSNTVNFTYKTKSNSVDKYILDLNGKKSKAFDLVGKKITFMEQQKQHEIKKYLKDSGGVYDESMLPYELRYSLQDATQFRDDMQNKNQQMFKMTMLINTHAKTIEQLNDTIFQITTIARKNNCKFSSLDYMQEKGLNSTLPLGKNFVPIERTLTTASTAIFIPFTNMELYQSGGIYYGLNAISKNLLFFDRRSLKAGNGLIFGTPGSGKSFAAKREMISVLLNDPTAEVIILDPEREYSNLARGFDGEIIDISASSKSHINAFDINLDYADENDPISLKSEFIISLIELLAGGNSGLSSAERTVIDRTAIIIYQKYFQYADESKMPTLVDFWETLKEQPEDEAKSLALSLEVYVKGSLSTFAHKTNVDIKKRLVVFDMKDLGKQLKPMGMLIVLDQIWNRITENRNKGRRTWLYIDEMQLFFSSEQCSSYFFELWSRARKWGAIPTGITQNVETLLMSDDGRRILSNSVSSFVMMLNQSKIDGDELSKLLNISDELMTHITNSDSGHGLLFAGKSIIPFEDKFPDNTQLYKMMTTKVEELNQTE